MRPLEGVAASYGPFAREASLALLRVSPLTDDIGVDAAETLSEAAWGRPLLATVFGKDAEGRLLVDLVDAESNLSMAQELVGTGLARVARSEAKRIRRRAGITAAPRTAAFDEASRSAAAAGDKEMAHLIELETAQAEAKENRAGMWKYGDIGDSDLEDGPRGGAGGGRGGARGGRGGAWGARGGR